MAKASPTPPAPSALASPTVMKFGGAALRDAGGLTRVARIVAATPGPRIVVTSAMEGVTDQLLAAQMDAARDAQAVGRSIAALRQRHGDALAGNGEARKAIDGVLERLERLLYGIAYTQEVTPRLHDLVQSFGERLACIAVAQALRDAGVPARALDAEAAAVRSQGPFGNARADLPALRAECAPRLAEALARGEVPVVTGYYGVDRAGHATLFGRGGSDYVAALVAYAVAAGRLELWKDVAGFLTADPRAVPQARLVAQLGYDEAAELAHFGAKVLHPRTVEPLEADGIPVDIRWVQDPKAPGTRIRAGTPPGPSLVRSVASMPGLAILRLNGPGMAYNPGVARQVFERLAGQSINVINMAASQASFALLIDEKDAARAEAALAPLVGSVVSSIEARPGRSLVCVVGKGLGETPGSAARILGAVAGRGVNVEMISLGASMIAIDFIVQSPQAADAVRAVHDAFAQAEVGA